LSVKCACVCVCVYVCEREREKEHTHSNTERVQLWLGLLKSSIKKIKNQTNEIKNSLTGNKLNINFLTEKLIA
jgi:hypothetical protein